MRVEQVVLPRHLGILRGCKRDLGGHFQIYHSFPMVQVASSSGSEECALHRSPPSQVQQTFSWLPPDHKDAGPPTTPGCTHTVSDEKPQSQTNLPGHIRSSGPMPPDAVPQRGLPDKSGIPKHARGSNCGEFPKYQAPAIKIGFRIPKMEPILFPEPQLRSDSSMGLPASSVA